MQILIVADHDETLIQLREEVEITGVRVRTTRRLADAWAENVTFDGIVLFPDEFDPDEILEGMTCLLRRRPHITSILVTEDLRRFASLLRQNADSVVPVILPRPAWGSVIFDILQARLSSDSI